MDTRTTKSFTLMHLAAYLSDSDDAAATFLHCGVAKEAIASCGRSALHCEAAHGHLVAT